MNISFTFNFKQMGRSYNIDVQTFNSSDQVIVDQRCNCWTAQNQGDVPAYVNGKLLKGFPLGHPELDGGSYGPTGNADEIYIGEIQITFAPGLVPGSSIQMVQVIQKYYTE